jgi:hypothetical protein
VSPEAHPWVSTLSNRRYRELEHVLHHGWRVKHVDHLLSPGWEVRALNGPNTKRDVVDRDLAVDPREIRAVDQDVGTKQGRNVAVVHLDHPWLASL